jgi:TolA-binding protein
MAEKKSGKLKRLVAVQRHMEQMAQFDLASTARLRVENQERMDDVLNAIGSTDPVHQAFSNYYASRYSRLRNMDQQIANLQEVQEIKVQKEKTKADKLEENLKSARQDEDREADDNAIYDLLEMIIGSSATASSKLDER